MKKMLLVYFIIAMILGALAYRQWYSSIKKQYDDWQLNSYLENEVSEVIFLEINEKNLAKLTQRKKIADKFGRGHRVFDPRQEKFQLHMVNENDTIAYKSWLKGGTSGHYNGGNFPSINLKNKHSKFGLVRLSARGGITEYFINEIAKYMGLMTLDMQLTKLYVNDVFKGFYWKETFIDNIETDKNGYLIEFDLDYIWSRNIEGAKAWSPLNEDIFYQAPLQIKKIGKPFHKLETDVVTPQWLLEKMNPEVIAKYFFLIDLIGDDHGLGAWNVSFFYDPEKDELFLICKDFQGLTFMGRKNMFNNRNFLFENIAQYRNEKSWPMVLGDRKVVWYHYKKLTIEQDIKACLQKVLKKEEISFFRQITGQYWLLNKLEDIIAQNHQAILSEFHQLPLLHIKVDSSLVSIKNYSYQDLLVLCLNDTNLLFGLRNNKQVCELKLNNNKSFKIINILTDKQYRFEELNEKSDLIFK
jgi:hypothetical protein